MSLSDKALLLTVDFSIPSGRKVDKQVSNDIADQYNIDGGRKSSGNFNKITIDSKYLKEPQNIKRKVVLNLPRSIVIHGGGWKKLININDSENIESKDKNDFKFVSK